MSIGERTPAAAASDGEDGSFDTTVPFRSVGFTVSSIGHAVARRFGKILMPLELEPREFALLRAVAATEGQSQQALRPSGLRLSTAQKESPVIPQLFILGSSRCRGPALLDPMSAKFPNPLPISLSWVFLTGCPR